MHPQGIDTTAFRALSGHAPVACKACFEMCGCGLVLWMLTACKGFGGDKATNGGMLGTYVELQQYTCFWLGVGLLHQSFAQTYAFLAALMVVPGCVHAWPLGVAAAAWQSVRTAVLPMVLPALASAMCCAMCWVAKFKLVCVQSAVPAAAVSWQGSTGGCWGPPSVWQFQALVFILCI